MQDAENIKPSTSETEKLARTLNKGIGCFAWATWIFFCWLILLWALGFEVANFIIGIVLFVSMIVAVVGLIRGEAKK